LAKAAWLLLSERRVSIDGAGKVPRQRRPEDLRHELIVMKRCAVDEDGTHLVWAGTAEDTQESARSRTCRQYCCNPRAKTTPASKQDPARQPVSQDFVTDSGTCRHAAAGVMRSGDR
jgi:hypothetical protein